MYSLLGFVVIALCTQFASAQQYPNIPEQCRRPPPTAEKPVDCCSLPPLFSETDYKECNFKKIAPQKGPPPGPIDCSRHKCILQRNNLTTTDGKINPSLAGQYLDKWVESTSDPAGFSEVMNLVKNRCLTDAPQPPNVPGACPHARFLMCSSSILFMKCPQAAWSTIPVCNELRDYFVQCSDIMIKYF